MKAESLQRVLVTGGAGFIGSHLVDSLLSQGRHVLVVDNLSNGRLENLGRWLHNPKLTFIREDLKNREAVEKTLNEVGLVFHFAANPEVKVGETDPSLHFDENLSATFTLLEGMRKSETAKTIVFASTSTVYGDAAAVPTPEGYGPLTPISTYGASKLGCEALISAYSHTFGLRGLILRLANIVGPRSQHGVVVDFIGKLRANPRRLKILGDGSQKKSYLHVRDCVDAVHATARVFVESEKTFDTFNVGSADQVTVSEIARIVCDVMGLRKVAFSFSGGVDGGRGWRGDVKLMQLSIDKLRAAGWTPRYSSAEAVRSAAKELLETV